jgi:hypothetical protein
MAQGSDVSESDYIFVTRRAPLNVSKLADKLGFGQLKLVNVS